MAKRIDRGVGNINDFPDDVLGHMISFLPTKDAVRTSVLSTRWRNLFAFLSNLDLEVKANNVEEVKRFMNSVDGLMFYLNKPSAVKFRLEYGGSTFDQKGCCESIGRVGDWICALIRHNIKELDTEFDIIETRVAHNYSFLPPLLFSCESLVVLKLNLPSLNMQAISDRICLPNLKIIHFKWTQFPNNSFVEELFSSCPVLEDLVLNGCCFIGDRTGDPLRFNISNQNLKTLTLKNINSVRSARILINAPSLVILNYHISRSCSPEFIDVKSLSEALITSSMRLPINFVTVIRWMQNIEALTIGFFILRVLKHVPIPLFEKMTYLKIWFQEFDSDRIGFDPIALEYFLAHCVALKTLVFEESQMFNLRRTNKRYSLQESQLAPLLRHLKTVEIRLLDIEHMIVLTNVIKFFLKNAKVLEVLKISSKEGSPEEQFKITRRIMNYPRASKKCSVVFF